MIDTIAFIKKSVLAISIIVALHIIIRFIFAQKSVYYFFQRFGITPIGTKKILFLSLNALVIGLFTRNFPSISNPLVYFAVTAPFIGLFNTLINKQPIRLAVADIPLIGGYLTCPLATEKKVKAVRSQMKAHGIEQSEIDKIHQCNFTCPHCRGLDAVKIVGEWSFINVALPWLVKVIRILK